MNIVTIIGTRPQYIKVKPLYDYCKKNNINNYLIDTNQHYSDNVSTNLIKELNLTIDKNLWADNSNEINFISEGISMLADNLHLQSKDVDCVVVLGDTNSTLMASIVAHKMGIKLCHIEAGIRCGDKKRPEEMNRILVDEMANIHFISRRKDAINVSNPVYVGDLEYSFLNKIEKNCSDITYDGSIVMTIHRQENINEKSLNRIFDFCNKVKYPIVFPLHHRTDKVIKRYKITIPDNIEIIEPVNYKVMNSLMRVCKGIISDSGGIVKTSPFFGKKCVVPLDKVEWDEVINKGYATNKLDPAWFDEYKVDRDKGFYYVKDSCDIIVSTLRRL